MFIMSPHHPAGKKVLGILAGTIVCCGLMIHSQLGSDLPTSLPSLRESEWLSPGWNPSFQA
jgi:hypothetical protein